MIPFTYDILKYEKGIKNMAQFTNQAQLSYNNSIRNSNVAVGEIQEVLSASKIAVSADYNANDRVSYAISMINSGPTALTGITVSDNLGAYTSTIGTLVPLDYIDGTLRYYVNGVLQNTPTITPGTSLQVSNLVIPADSTAMLLYEANVNQYAPLADGDSIDNQAVISGAGVTPITVNASLPVDTEPNLFITKSISPVPVTENGTLTYTFVIQNTGNRAADESDNAIITDIFNPILSGLNVTFNNTAWTENTDYTYNEADGTFTSVAGRITVPAAAYAQDPTTGAWTVTPGVSTLVISGIV